MLIQWCLEKTNNAE